MDECSSWKCDQEKFEITGTLSDKAALDFFYNYDHSMQEKSYRFISSYPFLNLNAVRRTEEFWQNYAR